MKKILCVILTLVIMASATATIFAADIQTSIGYSKKNMEDDPIWTEINEKKGSGTITLSNQDKAINMKELVSDGNVIDDVESILSAYKYFYITDVEGLQAFSTVVSKGTNKDSSVNVYSFKGKTVYLMNDIEFNNNETMLPIGENKLHYRQNATHAYGYQFDNNAMYYQHQYFSGTFDGRCFSISGLKMDTIYSDDYSNGENSDYSQGNGVALFKSIRGDATIKNLVIDNTCEFKNTSAANTAGTISNKGQGNGAASLVCYALAASGTGYNDNKNYTIENVISYASVSCTSTDADKDASKNYRHNIAGGIVAGSYTNIASDANITNCTFAGIITDAGTNAGGILGMASCTAYRDSASATSNITNSINVKYCVNSATINATQNAGGIIGGLFSGAHERIRCVVANCSNSGDAISENVLDNDSTTVGYEGYNIGSANKTNTGTSSIFTQYDCVSSINGLSAVGARSNISYSSARCTTLTASGSDAAAVGKTVNYKGLQVKQPDGNTTSVRFIASIKADDLSAYSSVGFHITAVYNVKNDGVPLPIGSGRSIEASTDKVYKTINAYDPCTANTFTYNAEKGEYFIVVNLDNLSTELGNVTFVVVPFCISADGNTTTYGDAKYTTINMATGNKA